MKTGPGDLKSLVAKSKLLAGKLFAAPKTGAIAISAVVILFVLQLYFVQELLAAELLFGMAFVALLLLGGLLYLLGAVGERSFDWTEAGMRVLAVSARRGYTALEEISRKSFRHPRSESAQ